MANVKTVELLAHMGGRFQMESKFRNHHVIIDQTKAGGGEDAGPTPLEYLLLSLAGCIGAIGRIIANQRRLALRSMEIRVVGEIDTDALMGKTSENRAGFSSITAIVKVDADMSQEEKEKFLHEIDSRCPISDNLKATTDVEIALG
jgi:putative redox protein